MSFIPTVAGRRGAQQGDFTSAKREEHIQRIWTFLRGLSVTNLRIPLGAANGRIATADDEGNLSWGAVLPATTATITAETANQTATLVASALGEYIVTIYYEVVTAGTGGTLYAELTYTDDVGVKILRPLASLPCNATGRDGAVVVLRCAGGGIDYTFEIQGGVGSPAYSAFISVTQVR